MNLGDLTVRNLELRPTAPAVIFEGRTITHAEFSGRAFRLANALIGLGIQRGDRVAVLAQNCPEYMEAYAAGELGSWTTVTINFRQAMIRSRWPTNNVDRRIDLAPRPGSAL